MALQKKLVTDAGVSIEIWAISMASVVVSDPVDFTAPKIGEVRVTVRGYVSQEFRDNGAAPAMIRDMAFPFETIDPALRKSIESVLNQIVKTDPDFLDAIEV